MGDRVVTLPTLYRKPPSDGGTEPPDMDLLLERVDALEKDATAIKMDLAVIKSNYATKADVTAIETSIIKWLVGTAIALTGLAFAAAKLIH
jgi:hypothetical protein